MESIDKDVFGYLIVIKKISIIVYARTLAAIGLRQICVPKNGRQFSNKDFPRGQVNDFVITWTLKKIKEGQTKK